MTAVRQFGRIRARIRNWTVIVVALVLLFLVWQVSNAIKPPMALVDGQRIFANDSAATFWQVLNAISSVAMWLFLLFGGAVLLVGGLQALGWLARNFGGIFEFGVDEETEPDEDEKAAQELGPVVMQHVETIGTNLTVIEQRIEVLHARRSRAQTELQKISPLAGTLVRLIKGVAAKMNALEKERDRLRSLRTAIAEDDEQALAEAAAMVGDRMVVTLATDPNRGVYVERLQTMISGEVGSLTRQLDLLGTLAQDWINHLLDFRLQMDELTTLIESSEALPLVVEIQGRLTNATEALGIDEARLQALMASRMLPRIVVEPRKMAEEYAPALEGEL